MKTFRNTLLGLFILVGGAAYAEPIGDIISYQGKLTDAAGNPVANGTHNVAFKIYENGTATPYSQTIPVNTLGGVFNAFLSVGALSFDPAKTYELGIAVDGGAEISPKQTIASVPVAKVSQLATTVPDGAITQVQAPFALTGPAPNYRLETGNWEGVPTILSPSSIYTAYVHLTFSHAFEKAPVVVVTPLYVYQPDVVVTIGAASTTGVNVFLTRPDGWPAGQGMEVYWIAVGK